MSDKPPGYRNKIELLHLVQQEKAGSAKWLKNNDGVFWVYLYSKTETPVDALPYKTIQLANGCWLDTDSYTAEMVYRRLTKP